MVLLNLGAGSDVREGYVNVDVVKLDGIDVVHDLDEAPWPFDADISDEVLALDIFEHVEQPLTFVSECHRVLRPDGLLTVRSPHYGTWAAGTDPTHRRAVTPETFDFWVPGTQLNRTSGAAYAQGRHFRKQSVRREGDNVVFDLVKIGR